jgi:hypothetical protein
MTTDHMVWLVYSIKKSSLSYDNEDNHPYCSYNTFLCDNI